MITRKRRNALTAHQSIEAVYCAVRSTREQACDREFQADCDRVLIFSDGASADSARRSVGRLEAMIGIIAHAQRL